MLIAIHGTEASCSLLYMNRSFMHIAIHGLKLNAHYYT